MLDGLFSRYAADMPPYWGYRDEFRSYLAQDYTLREAVDAHLKLWDLRKIEGNEMTFDLNFFHEVMHILRGMAALVPPHTPDMVQTLRDCTYQGEMETELDIFRLQYVLHKMAADPDWFDLRYDAAPYFAPAPDSDFMPIGTLGRIGAFILGRAEDKTMFEIRRRYHFHDAFILQAALKLFYPDMSDPKDITEEQLYKLYSQVQPGDTYVVDKCILQTFEPVSARKADRLASAFLQRLKPAFKIIDNEMNQLRRETGVDFKIEANENKIGHIKVRALYAAMLENALHANHCSKTDFSRLIVA